MSLDDSWDASVGLEIPVGREASVRCLRRRPRPRWPRRTNHGVLLARTVLNGLKENVIIGNLAQRS
jgi:hypothetical protein